MSRVRTAALISGRGSNLAALLEAAASQAFPAEISLVVSNRPDAGGLEHAARYGVPAVVVDHRNHADRRAFEAALQSALAHAGIELICLAGFMRLLTPEFVEHWRDRMINIHPSLLPSFKGLGTHEQALAAGVRVHGATVHFVRTEMDSGPIILQAAVAVMPDDTVESLAARVLQVEHRIYPLALAAVAGGDARVTDGRLVLRQREAGSAPPPLIWPTI